MGTFFVITDPAAMYELLPILTGAIIEEFVPIKQLSPIFEWNLFFPSKLQVIVPAPILEFLPIVLSPKYDRWLTLTLLANLEFFISTKLPILTSSCKIASGLSLAKGPIKQFFPT